MEITEFCGGHFHLHEIARGKSHTGRTHVMLGRSGIGRIAGCGNRNRAVSLSSERHIRICMVAFAVSVAVNDLSDLYLFVLLRRKRAARNACNRTDDTLVDLNGGASFFNQVKNKLVLVLIFCPEGGKSVVIFQRLFFAVIRRVHVFQRNNTFRCRRLHLPQAVRSFAVAKENTVSGLLGRQVFAVIFKTEITVVSFDDGELCKRLGEAQFFICNNGFFAF